MAYDELKDREMELEESRTYEDDSLYEPADTFGEQLGEPDEVEEKAIDEEETSAESRVEQGFGETLSSDTNPHLADQMDDEQLSREAEADYERQESQHEESLIDKAKDRFNEWTNREK
jgi:hypothetical protein